MGGCPPSSSPTNSAGHINRAGHISEVSRIGRH